MEFIQYQEAVEALELVGLTPALRDEDHLFLDILDDVDVDHALKEVSHLHLADAACTAAAHDGAQAVAVPAARLGESVDAMIGLLHLAQVLVFPVGKWQSVFDAVAFSLASNEDWQEVDAMATLRLKTRDPLLCEPGDYHTLQALIEALMSDAESPDQGILITSTAKPFYAEVVPEGALRVMVGSQVLADEIVEGLHIE